MSDKPIPNSRLCLAPSQLASLIPEKSLSIKIIELAILRILDLASYVWTELGEPYSAISQWNINGIAMEVRAMLMMVVALA